MGGDKIVLLDGAGANGGGAATNGLLSMIPGMFANLIGGNKMDPNLVAALMNGRNNQDGFGGANGWWLWIIVLFWLWGGRGFGNGFGNGGDCCANGLPAQLNNDYGRELLMQAIQGNRSAIDQIASALNCSTTQLQNAICNVQGAIDKVAGQVGMTSQAVINAVQQQGCEIGNQISSCCCNLSSLINQSTCQTQGMITQQGFDNQLRTLEQTNILQNGLNQGLANNREQATSQFNILSAKLDAQTVMINDKFCQLEMREMHKINDLRSDFQWKLAHQLCKQYDYIFIEDLNIEGMKRLWGKKVSDLSHSSFIDKLMYVSSKYGVTIHKIDKWYPSSKTCECGCINKGLSLRDRTWVCPACGAINDRDVLAAKNILRKGISELESKSNSSDSNIGVSCVCIQESHLL